MKWTYKVVNTPFKHPFTTNKGTKIAQKSLWLQLDFLDIIAYGECPEIFYYQVDTAIWIKKIEENIAFFDIKSPISPFEFYELLQKIFLGDNFLISAFDMAYWDWYAKWKGKSLGNLLQIPVNQTLKTDYTLGTDTAEKMQEKIDETQWEWYKIKITKDFPLSILNCLDFHKSTVVGFDMNESWNENELEKNLPILLDFDPKFIEEPVQRQYDGTIKNYVLKYPNITWVADESFRNIDDFEHCIQSYNAVNIKLTKCGGITAALAIIDLCEKHHIKIMFGSMNETAIGTAALIHLSSKADFLDIDGPLLLDDHNTDGVYYENFIPKTQQKLGLGVAVIW